jgi:predicted transcriptional regulator
MPTDGQESQSSLGPYEAYAVALSEAGYGDALHTFDDPDERVLTRRRLEIVRTLAESPEVESIRALARRLDRHVSVVKGDLDVLARNDLVTYEESGGAKAPRLKHDTVLIKPLVLDGEFQWSAVLDEE